MRNMVMESKTKIWIFTFLLFVVISCIAVPADAQRRVSTIMMKSGVQYEGDVFPATGVSTLKAFDKTNIVRIDDGLREIFVGQRRVETPGESDRNELEIPIFQRDYKGQELASDIIYVGPFNEKGHREFVVAGVGMPYVFTQAITRLNPRYCELKILAISDNPKTFQWTMRVGTDTIPTNVLRSLLRREISDGKNPTEYIRVADFLIQANRYDAAREEIKFIKTQFPDLDERMNEALDAIRQAYARQILREIRMRMDAGQIMTAMTLARAVNKSDLAMTLLAEFAELEEKFDDLTKQLEQAREKVNSCINQVTEMDASQTEAVRRLKIDLETELNPINMPRLDAFLRLAEDPTIPPHQKLALIISGWTLGSNNAIENLAIAQELFDVRDLLGSYFSARQSTERDQIVERLKQFESGNPQQLSAMIQQIKPFDAPDLSQYNGREPIEFLVEIPRPAIAQDQPPFQFRCLVHLPTEYNPYRKYPLLISLPPVTQTVEQNLDMWCGGIFSPTLNQRIGHAERNGYIVMSVDWRLPGQATYQYSAVEHKTVLKALRQALRKFSVDTDRVFLAGHADGGDAAFDIGLSHPEHWAGIVGVSAGLKKFVRRYYQNEHWNLPVYCVAGKRDNASMEMNQDIWTEWVANTRYVDATVIWYHGRGAEMFDREEMPETFKWMNAQRRKWPDRSEFSINCKIFRPWDNYYWFIELDPASLPTDKMVFPEAYSDKTGGGTGVEAFYKTVNRFRINRSTKALTMWLSPDFVDFSQEISISGQVKEFKGKVTPSVKVLLEDVRQRSDREHPYWARLDLSNQQWIAK